MRGWLLDTNVLSELRRPRPDAKVVEFIKTENLESLFVSCITLAEIRFGIEQVASALKREELTLWLEQGVRPMFKERVLPVTEEVMLRWRLLVEEGRRIGHTFSQPDLIIAATALKYGLTLVTRNERDFALTPALVFNPWS